MRDLNNNPPKFHLPEYIHIPVFLYQDSRLERPALVLAAFFYSLHTSGKKITASTDYLCELAQVKKRQLYNIMNLLEHHNYIRRTGFTNSKKLQWVYDPKPSITLTETDTSALQCTSVQNSTVSAMQNTKLVHSSTLNLCNAVHTDNKVNTKDYKKLTTVEPTPSSSSFFSQKQKGELLSLKQSTDFRTDELFLQHCQCHMETQVNDLTKFQRFTGIKNLLKNLIDSSEHFQAKDFNKSAEITLLETRNPTEEEFNRYKSCEKGLEWVGLWVQKQRQKQQQG